MSKENAKKATFKDLLEKKIQKEKDKNKTKEIYIDSMDATLTFNKPSDDVVLDAVEIMGNEKDTRKIVEAYKNLIYLTCKTLQDVELQKELEVVDPFDTVSILFSLGEILEIGNQIMELVDMQGVVTEIKN